MVLPGIQALFGFQLIAAFSERFKDLPASTQWFYLGAVGLVVFSIMLILMPAVFHRVAEPGKISHRFIQFASRCIEIAMAPLALAIAIDIAVLVQLITEASTPAIAAGAVCFAGFFLCWYVLPYVARRRRAPRD